MRSRALACLVLVACGGGRGSGPAPSRPSGRADIPAMRAVLERWSSSGRYVVTSYESLPRRFVLGDTTVTIGHSSGFGDYFDDGAPENLTGYMATAVHEVYHGWSSTMALQLLVETGASARSRADAVYVGREPMLVVFGATFPAREMDADFPAEARTRRYPTYVSQSPDAQSTQQEGVIGLLEEWAAYYHSARTTFDLWGWVRDESALVEKELNDYVVQLHQVPVPHAEFKLFILHYLLHAREHRPAIYRELMANQSFKRAFVACDAAWVALLAEAETLEPTVHAFARMRGYEVDVAGGELTYHGSPFPVRDPVYPAVVARLASRPYREIEAALRR